MNIQQTGENGLIQRLKRLVPGRSDVIVGIGDDCAVVRTGRRDRHDLLLKSDPVIEGIHFTPEANAMEVGHKALGRVLSDIAAMGGEPLWALVDLVVPGTVSVSRVESLYQGMARLARAFNVALVGGDTSRGNTLELHVFAVGRVPRGGAILRTGARCGDCLYVTGSLGGSGVGHHLRFQPRLREGAWLRENRWVTAMMDLSDGIASDLKRLTLASGVGALLEAERIPVSPAARRAGGTPSPLDHALSDGEDFELLFTVPRRKADDFETAWHRAFRLRCTRIGVMTGRKGVIQLNDARGCKRLKLRGYEHFR